MSEIGHHVELVFRMPWWARPVMEAYSITGNLTTLPAFIEQMLMAGIAAELVEDES